MQTMAIDLKEEQIRHVLQGIKIPPQPQILVDLQMEQVMPDPDLNQIAKLISQDVGLAGTILKIVNSSVFGLANKITSVQQAVHMLGLNSVVNIVNGISIKSELSDEAIVALNRFWDTATDIAVVSVDIAKQIHYRSPDEAYALGLFHNVGIPLLMEKFPDYLDVMEQAYKLESARIIDAENACYNTNHAVVGYYTAKSWNLPLHICQVIADHHSVSKVLGDSDDSETDIKTLLCILKLAEHICGNYRILGRQQEDHEWQLISEKVLVYLGLGSYDLELMEENFAELGIGQTNYR